MNYPRRPQNYIAPLHGGKSRPNPSFVYGLPSSHRGNLRQTVGMILQILNFKLGDAKGVERAFQYQVFLQLR
jgi:hypothetical protein